MNAINQGTTTDRRHGDRVMMTAIRVRGKIYFAGNIVGSKVEATAGSNVQVHYLVYDKKPGGSLPQMTDIF